MSDELITRDLKHLWHPCSQMKDYENFAPLKVKSAQGPYIQLADGRQIIDAVSSWWCKSLGHNHPRLKKALLAQVEKFEHVILANTTNEVIVSLSEKLASLTKTLDKVMYASDGSCAVEIAMKMSVHARKILGEEKRTKFMALANGYHGETCATLSVSDLGLYRDAYRSMLFDVEFIQDLPYVTGVKDPLWNDCGEYWSKIEAQLNRRADELTAILFEPILQGAGGMVIYSQDLLRRLRRWADKNNVHLIADEIMTGFGRTGKALACQYANIEPDFLCLSKALTSGWLPMSVMLTSDKIYRLFYDDYEKGKSFLHSHTYTGNALAAAVALECFNVIRDESIYQHAHDIGGYMRELMNEVVSATGKLHNVRSIGVMVAADLKVDSKNTRAGYAVYQKAVKLGALLRPLGNTIYWFPPLNTDRDTLKQLRDVTIKACL